MLSTLVGTKLVGLESCSVTPWPVWPNEIKLKTKANTRKFINFFMIIF